VNYSRGSDQSKWHATVPNYTQAVYDELWTGIDLKLRKKDGSLKYEFHLRPGAHVEDIRLAYRGADRVFSRSESSAADRNQPRNDPGCGADLDCVPLIARSPHYR